MRIRVPARRPPARRYALLPLAEQWACTIRIAMDFALGRAGYSRADGNNSRSREIRWTWQHRGAMYWMLPPRINARVLALYQAAEDTASYETCPTEDSAAAVLRRWQRSGHWRRIVWPYSPRHPWSPRPRRAWLTGKRRRVR